jgi:mandelate racemase
MLGSERRLINAHDSRHMSASRESAAADAAAAVAAGYGAMKIKMGRPRLEDDLVVFRATKAEIPDGFHLMVDLNRSLGVEEAIRRGKAFESEGAYWIEEPLRADAFRGLARVRRELSAPISIGENFGGPAEMQGALAVCACDLVSPDVGNVGGITGFLRCAAIAQVQSVPMSSHIYPEISAHVLPAVPTAHYLEWMDLAGRLKADDRAPVNGKYLASEQPGIGLERDLDAVTHHTFLND